MQALAFATPPANPPEAETLRQDVRGFLADALADRTPQQRAESWTGNDPAVQPQDG